MPMVSREQVKALLMGIAVGDALGLPVELKQRIELQANPITDLTGHGTHNQAPGTWSDDTAMALCQAEALAERVPAELDKLLADAQDMLLRWYEDAEWTANGAHFDLSLSVRSAMMYLESGVDPAELPEFVEHAHGNDALVRCLPLALMLVSRPQSEVYESVKVVCSLTHPHPVAILASVFGVQLAIRLLQGQGLPEALKATQGDFATALDQARASAETRARFERLLGSDMAQASEADLQAAGDAAQSVEVAVWCLLTTTDYRSAVLKAVNLGDDADTNASLTGALAGLVYGIAGIPESWQKGIARSADIADLANRVALSLA